MEILLLAMNPLDHAQLLRLLLQLRKTLSIRLEGQLLGLPDHHLVLVAHILYTLAGSSRRYIQLWLDVRVLDNPAGIFNPGLAPEPFLGWHSLQSVDRLFFDS
jgi:hypothetical protein